MTTVKTTHQFRTSRLKDVNGNQISYIGNQPIEVFQRKGDVNHTCENDLIPFGVISNLKVVEWGDIRKNTMYECIVHSFQS